jgi:hypothetical protein
MRGEKMSREDVARDARMTRSLRDLYAPVRKQIAESGIREDELDAFIEAAREEYWMERKARHPVNKGPERPEGDGVCDEP